MKFFHLLLLMVAASASANAQATFSMAQQEIMYNSSSGFIVYREVHNTGDTTYVLTNGLNTGMAVGALFGMNADKSTVWINLGNREQAITTLASLLDFKTPYYGTIFIALNNIGGDYAVCTIKQRKNIQLYEPECFTIVDESKVIDNRKEICKSTLSLALNAIKEDVTTHDANVPQQTPKKNKTK